MAYNSLMIFTGNANPKLAADVAKARATARSA